MHIEPVSSIEEISALLAESALPITDISVSPPLQFFGIRDGGALVAVVGLELYPPFGLLRSLSVHCAFRKRGFARELVSFAESWSASKGVESLFLLTATADQYFLGLGYSHVSRDEAPPSIRATSQFSGLCPASSAFLSKRVAARANPAVQGTPRDQASHTPNLQRQLPMPMLRRIHHVAIICADYEVSRRFYTEILGLQILAEHYRSERESYKLDLALPDGSQIELFSFPNPPRRPSSPEARGLRHLAFEVENVAACKSELESKGVAVEAVRVDEYTNKRFVFFADPDGLPLELYEA